MYDIVILSDSAKETDVLKASALKYQMQKNMDIHIESFVFGDNYSFAQDAAIYIVDSKSAQSKQTLAYIRKTNADNMIVLLISNVSDLINVMTPQTMPSGILQKPIEYSEIELLLTQLSDTIDQRNSSDKRFVWTTKARTHSIPMKKILYFESRNKVTYLVSSTKEYELHLTLDSLENELPKEFVRIHRGYLVNLDRISEYDFGTMTAIMDDGSTVLISRSGKEKLKGGM